MKYEAPRRERTCGVGGRDAFVRYSPKTVAKWKKRTSVADLPTGPKETRSTILSFEEVMVAFRKHTLLPLNGCLYALRATIPHLTRSSLNRCLQRHGISQSLDQRLRTVQA